MMHFDCLLVTGGAGFIGSNFIRCLLGRDSSVRVVNLDLLTYAGSKRNLVDLPDESRHTFVCGNICDNQLVPRVIREHEVGAIVNFAAESHVDRSIDGPASFVNTNMVGTFLLLEAARIAWAGAFADKRFLQVSTDEVFGSLGPKDPPFTEETRYAPNSPYSASKAAADHMVRAYHETYHLPTVITNCSNNYGPFQYPEKLIPLVIVNALSGKSLPIYGDGLQVRDWLFVEDHCEAIISVLQEGRVGQTYNVGGNSEMPNIEIVYAICDRLDSLRPRIDGISYRNQIVHVQDRPGHDRRYAINFEKIKAELGWVPCQSFDSGICRTVDWYLENLDWVKSVTDGRYDDWIALNYNKRRGG